MPVVRSRVAESGGAGAGRKEDEKEKEVHDLVSQLRGCMVAVEHLQTLVRLFHRATHV